MAINALQLGRWEWEVATEQLTWSEATRRMYEVPLDGPVTPATFQALIHPEDRHLLVVAEAESAGVIRLRQLPVLDLGPERAVGDEDALRRFGLEGVTWGHGYVTPAKAGVSLLSGARYGSKPQLSLG